jgi:hypothetical protein
MIIVMVLDLIPDIIYLVYGQKRLWAFFFALYFAPIV